MSQISIAFSTEGNTDVRLLEGILQRTFISVGGECTSQIEVIDPIISVNKEHGNDFVTQMESCAKKAFANGAMVFCVHVDADSANDQLVITNKIKPLSDFFAAHPDSDICKILVSIIPVHMSESWMLADKELLKEEIGTDKTDLELGLNRPPESYADPKSAIEAAIRIARQNMVRRRRHELKISDLYRSIGQKIELHKLEQLPSFLKFKESVRDSYKSLNYLH
ncbi:MULTISPECIES: DUF4276 family protein [unclassified Mucilaginibacter]|uniref:DUF4276 family protein n=1 Tax=unclassified Mucilaginibacter TaxID=2617802 RepID=UPI002AC93E1E|nr:MULTISPECIES: DUF4276 family protein [unclassified Mucilaginibacter]MEB0262343.1 DUF4276 family protein [Mucilaginibacter sp. 10I4]MEB0279990.1 DUF4276 family protein [Mucilaginibacter sp. 10B2]MEB0302625.1 DUF4276 family protein [Mucilaginibacter sp. 5C4]WPX21947.1 DUF4276 family protein [Mucilaginibacter sp. 5C4]